MPEARTITVALWCAAVLPAQSEPATGPLEAAMRRWIDSDHEDRAVLDAAVAAVLDAGQPGLEALSATARAIPADDARRQRGRDALISNVCLEFARRAVESGMVHAGQYDPLRALQPWAGRFFVGLVVDTPEWFPEDMRATVVPVLRDLFPEGPDRDTVALLEEIAEDVEFETEALRTALSYALAQWGRRALVAERIAELEEKAGEARTADELHFVRALAHLHYQLREYAPAADHWARFIAGRQALGDPPSAIDEYNAACCMARAHRTEAALAAIERCADALAAGRRDSPVELTPEMFATDPDLETIRPLPRFRAARKKAFAKSEDRR